MKPEGNQIKTCPITEDIKMSFMSPLSISSNFCSPHSSINKLGHTPVQNHKGEVTSSGGEAILSPAEERSMTDIYNGNLVRGGNPSEDLQGSSVGNPSRKRIRDHAEKKRGGQLSQTPKNVLPLKLTPDSPKDFP
ncbi:hypothetical protein JRQ81_017025, partial [Phrynocephalus forsythii]